MRTIADIHYLHLLANIKPLGDLITGRNGEILSLINPSPIRFDSAPFVTVRPVAYKKALEEMEWFFSNSPKCPENLLDWWGEQLNPDGLHISGYQQQFRNQVCYDTVWMEVSFFDQIAEILKLLKTEPTSRRIILSSWNPGEMADIQAINNNPKTPANCHTSLMQFFVRNDTLYAYTYQRSADILLGVPHNWIQQWGMLEYFAGQSNLKTGTLTWQGGDVHLYQEESHLACAKELLGFKEYFKPGLCNSVALNYLPSTKEFKASDFSFNPSRLGPPLSTIRPKLL